jgi:hypothetical protein
MYDRLSIAMKQITEKLGMAMDEESKIKNIEDKKEMVKLFADCRKMVLNR